MKTLLTLITLLLLATPTLQAQRTIVHDDALTTSETTRPNIRRTCCSEFYQVNEPYYDARPSLYFYYQWDEADEEAVRPLLLLGRTDRDEEGDLFIDSLATIPKRYGPMKEKFRYNECMEGNWSWTYEMVDTLGITRASIRRDCNEKLHAVVDDLQINLPEDVQLATKRRQVAGTME